MTGLVECIPNFSEGRSAQVVERIVAAISGVPGVKVLDYSLNPDHNRSVVTLVGSPNAVVEAAFQGARLAVELIDLRRHQGVHPRIGAVDVIPFVPLAGARLEDCIALAGALGRRLGSELGLPVFLYEAAASRPERRNLADIRRGQLGGLAERMAADEAWRPDYGPSTLHVSAGATVVGARGPLLAFNANLTTTDVTIAEELAKVVRYQGGGLRNVKALGVAEAGVAQVTMNLTDPASTPPHRVLAYLRAEAARHGVDVASTEIIGLAPLDSLLAAAEHQLQIRHLRREQILEWQLLGALGPNGGPSLTEPETLAGYVEALASAAPTPGGGSAAALVGALAAALGEMVANLTIGRTEFADVEERVQAVLADLTQARRVLVAAMAEDAAVFEAYMAARRLPRETAEQKAARAQATRQATLAATEAPLAVARRCLALLPLCDLVAQLGNPRLASDAGVAAVLAEAAVRAAGINVRVNLPALADAGRRAAFEADLAALEAQAAPLAASVVARVRQIIGA